MFEGLLQRGSAGGEKSNWSTWNVTGRRFILSASRFIFFKGSPLFKRFVWGDQFRQIWETFHLARRRIDDRLFYEATSAFIDYGLSPKTLAFQEKSDKKELLRLKSALGL